MVAWLPASVVTTTATKTTDLVFHAFKILDLGGQDQEMNGSGCVQNGYFFLQPGLVRATPYRGLDLVIHLAQRSDQLVHSPVQRGFSSLSSNPLILRLLSFRHLVAQPQW
ncbi:hypothetical protein B0T10DRAFT_478775 [Thelonectria olida]|uniref:Uncharacterized protein n=1 Tax=Thelonectria olida TaxID=1576542 RepID=A0A9P8WER3_9HYPO|nr:hypothetical protein B0T10DRAFT_478775 [Thelonectria olida]